ncbi:MAG: hypothetical protein HQL30_05595 [Candidatus Omnitrophica bacterium]|nr:hypothetical protein [Candidatus Omnitrophota bacterium]
MSNKIACLVVVFVLALSVTGFSEEVAVKKDLKETAQEAGKATVIYPANLLNESVKTIGDTAKNTVGVATETVKVTGETLSGDLDKAPGIVKTPIVKSAETVKDAAVDTLETPGKAAETTKEQLM